MEVSRATLRQYVRRRNGVPLGGRGSLTNMLRRSLGASSIAGFWRHWNPIWSYGLGRFVLSPARRILPMSFALILTFGVSGFLHDAVIMLLRWELALLFTPWFLVLGLGVVVTERFQWRFADLPPWQRASIILAYAFASLAVSLVATQALERWWSAT